LTKSLFFHLEPDMFRQFALLSILALSLPLVQAQPVPYVEGQHYVRIDPAQPTQAAPGKVEVIEVFSYACHACAAAQPEVDRWKKTMPATAQFDYLPAVFNPSWELAARGYYTAKALSLIDKTHQATFDANFNSGKPLATADDFARLYSTFGSNVEELTKTMNGFAVNNWIAQAKKRVMAYGVDSTPTLVVHGKWRITGRGAGSYMEMFKIAEFLIRMEAANLAKTAGVDNAASKSVAAR
jgi:protein dithiol oxidoreductase (disulfide-forming)